MNTQYLKILGIFYALKRQPNFAILVISLNQQKIKIFSKEKKKSANFIIIIKKKKNFKRFK